MQKDLIEHTTWCEIEEEHGGQFIRLGDLDDEQKDRLTEEALLSASPKIIDGMVDYFADCVHAAIFRKEPAEAVLNFMRCDAYVRLESDMQDEYDAYKEACREAE